MVRGRREFAPLVDSVADAALFEDRRYGEEGVPTASLIDNTMPVVGESARGRVFPDSAFDTDTAVNNIEHGQAARASLHAQRYDSVAWRVLGWVGRTGLVSKHWNAIPENEVHPRYVVYIHANWWRWLKKLSAILGILWWFYYIVAWAIGTDSVVLHNGYIVGNLWNTARVQTYNLADRSVAQWIGDNRASLKLVAPGAEFIEAHVYESGTMRNITTTWLADALASGCSGDAPLAGPKKRNAPPAEKCECMPAVEIGVFADAVFVDGEVLYNARVSSKTAEITRVRFADGVEADMPIAVLVEFMRRDGRLQRKSYGTHTGFCVFRAIQILRGLH